MSDQRFSVFSNPRFIKFVKIVFSIGILYHLVGITFMPSVQSIIVRERGWIFRPWLNQIGFNTTWNLFSPDPATAMFLRVKLVPRDEALEATDITIPDFADAINWDPTKRRALYMMRYAILDEQKVYHFFIPWLCRNHPGTKEIYIEGVGTRIPGIDQARRESLYKISELRYRQTVNQYRGECAEAE